MSAFSDDLAVLVTGASVATLGTTLFIGTKPAIPPGPTASMSIIESGGSGVDYIQNQSAPAYEHPSAFVVARAGSAEIAYNLALAAYNAMVGVHNQEISGTWYLWIRPMQSKPYDLGPDDDKRVQFAFNVMGCKRP